MFFMFEKSAHMVFCLDHLKIGEFKNDTASKFYEKWQLGGQ
jgi:hypothetical protein